MSYHPSAVDGSAGIRWLTLPTETQLTTLISWRILSVVLFSFPAGLLGDGRDGTERVIVVERVCQVGKLAVVVRLFSGAAELNAGQDGGVGGHDAG